MNFYQALSMFPPEVQVLVLASKELERDNPKAERKLLYEHPEVVRARQQIAALVKGAQ